jgi:polar amino acid transport system substrate-binding protein
MMIDVRYYLGWGLSLSAMMLAAGFGDPAAAQTIYNVGSTATAVPFGFVDGKANSVRGVMVDVIKAIAADADFAVNVSAIPAGDLVPSLTRKKIDIISAAIYITPARKEVIDFSDPVYTYGEGLAVKDPRGYRALDDLKGEVVGVLVGAAHTDALEKAGVFKDLRRYDSAADMLRDVNEGRLKAGFADYPMLVYLLGLGTYPQLRVVKNYRPQVVGSVGIGVRKTDPELRARIDASLARLKAYGTLDRILADWKLK